MAVNKTVLSDRARAQVVEAVLLLEFPDNPGAALGKHTMVRDAGPDWSRISAFDQRRGQLSDRNQCPDEDLIGLLCEASGVKTDDAPEDSTPDKNASPAPATKKARRFRFER
jgi:hypothetical protein